MSLRVPLSIPFLRSRTPRLFAAVALWMVSLFASLAPNDCRAQKVQPDLVLRGVVTYADRQTYRELPFAVPKGNYQSDGKRHWFRINIRSAEGKLLILGNPIYLNFQEVTQHP